MHLLVAVLVIHTCIRCLTGKKKISHHVKQKVIHGLCKQTVAVPGFKAVMTRCGEGSHFNAHYFIVSSDPKPHELI